MPDLLRGNQITTDIQTLATAGTPVTAIATDGATRVVVRLWANSVGDTLTLTLLNDQGLPSISADEDGTIEVLQAGGPFTTGPAPESGRRQALAQSATPQITVTAVGTGQGPRAFAIYYPPTNFDRAGKDASAGQRGISLRVTINSGPAAKEPE